MKHKAHEKAISISQAKDGLDFYFKDRSSAIRLIEFIRGKFPTTFQKSKKLVSHDTHSNTYKYKYVFCINLPKVCKNDLVVFPKRLCK